MTSMNRGESLVRMTSIRQFVDHLHGSLEEVIELLTLSSGDEDELERCIGILKLTLERTNDYEAKYTPSITRSSTKTQSLVGESLIRSEPDSGC